MLDVFLQTAEWVCNASASPRINLPKLRNCSTARMSTWLLSLRVWRRVVRRHVVNHPTGMMCAGLPPRRFCHCEADVVDYVIIYPTSSACNHSVASPSPSVKCKVYLGAVTGEETALLIS
jgi:hypothetical protein